jgi:hypothetical protein
MIFVVGGGGGGGPSASDAILTVTVPTGSTVTATKGGTTLTPTIWVQAADPTLDCALFVISPSLFDSVNPWTVAATLGTRTASTTVLITTNKEYDVKLVYTRYIVQDGVVQSGFTLANDVSYSDIRYVLTVTQMSGYTRLNTRNGYPNVWSTTSKIDVSAHNTMSIDFVATGLTNGPPTQLRGAGIGIMEQTVQASGDGGAQPLANAIIAYANTEQSSTNHQTVILDISSYSEMYLVVTCSAWGAANSQVDVYDWWLE